MAASSPLAPNPKYAAMSRAAWIFAGGVSFAFFFAVVIFSSGPSSPPAGGGFDRFIGRLEDGADCPELFEIRNSVDPSSPLIEEMNSHLREIGCVSSWSARVFFDRPDESFTVREYEIYRSVIDTPMNVDDDAARQAVAERHRLTVDEVRTVVDSVMARMFRNGWFGSPEFEIRHASDWKPAAAR